METIKNIVREMREYEQQIRNATDGCDPDVADNIATGVRDIANRIEAAAKSTIVTDNTETLHNLLDENARLKSVLVPILQCDPDKCSPMSAVFAIARARQIYNAEVK